MPDKPLHPYADAIPFSLTTPTPWLGGMVIPVPGTAANANLPVAHGLRRIPRFCWVVDHGRNAGPTTPVTRGISNAWTTATAWLSWPSTGDTTLLFFG